MKLLTIIFCLFVSVNLFAQDGDNTITILNNEIFKGDIKTIKPADIFSTTIMKPADAVKIYGQSGENGAVIITTRAFAKKLYQQKLGPFSKKYGAYIAAHADDSKLLYVINNTMLIAGTNRTLRELSDLTPDNIKDVSFKRDSRYTSDATVIITTKDYNVITDQ